MVTWRETYRCGCQGTYPDLPLCPGRCPTHGSPAIRVTCSNPVELARMLKSLKKGEWFPHESAL